MTKILIAITIHFQFLIKSIENKVYIPDFCHRDMDLFLHQLIQLFVSSKKIKITI